AHTNSDGSSSFSYAVPVSEGRPVNGSYSFYTVAHDKAGNDEAAKTSGETSTLEDTVKPATTDNVPVTYVNHDITVTLSAGDAGGSGVDKTFYTIDGSTPSAASAVYDPESKPVLTSDGEVIRYFSIDKAGNQEAVRSATAHIDRVAPTTSDDVPAAYVNHDITVTLSAGDTGGSGLDKTYYTTDGSTPSTSSPVYNPESKPVLTSNGQSIEYFSTDRAGNREGVHTGTAHIDRAAPATTDNIDANWHNAPVSVTLTATDTGGSGTKSTYYKLYTGAAVPARSDSGWQAYDPASRPALGNGQAIAYYSLDNAGNEESVKHSSAAKVDGVNGVTAGSTYTLGSVPQVVCTDSAATITYTGRVGHVTATCTDEGGAVSVTYTVAYCATELSPPVSGSWVTSAGSCNVAAPSPVVYNVAKAGSSVPIKFSLHGNQGLSIFAAGYPLSQQILATGNFEDSTVTETTNASGLTYDPSSDQYVYVWNTSKSWAGQSRQLVIELNDGVSYIRANFKLK
ncbi:MAG TPA: PxKF domain-containing protein, partial [Solirubrobacteraceae bacterium]|nr:PxKF domain-containing protein [Solirubrobacteraceae bacterium]